MTRIMEVVYHLEDLGEAIAHVAMVRPEYLRYGIDDNGMPTTSAEGWDGYAYTGAQAQNGSLLFVGRFSGEVYRDLKALNHPSFEVLAAGFVEAEGHPNNIEDMLRGTEVVQNGDVSHNSVIAFSEWVDSEDGGQWVPAEVLPDDVRVAPTQEATDHYWGLIGLTVTTKDIDGVESEKITPRIARMGS